MNTNDSHRRSSAPHAHLVRAVLRIAGAGLLLFAAAFKETGAQSSHRSSGDGFMTRLADLVFLAPLSLAADASASAGSDGNGVLEPGETVVVSPSWRNPGSSAVSTAGTASALGGPNAAFYSIPDTSADYGSIGPGETKASPTGDSYQVSVSLSAQRAAHSDAHFTETLSTTETNVWTLHLGDSFSDVPRGHPFYRKVETLLHNGITAGCFPATQFCPDDPVTRSQMSLFTARAMSGGGSEIPSSGAVGASPYNCVAGGVSLFADVAPEDIFCKHLHYLAGQNVDLACSPTELCPSQNVRRDAVAGFIAQALVAPGGDDAVPIAYGPDGATGRSYSCDAGAPNLHFVDVVASDPHCRHAHYLWARGFIAGCSDKKYCPDSDVTRGQMAKFLVNGFQLNLSSPTTPVPPPPPTSTPTHTATSTPTRTTTATRTRTPPRDGHARPPWHARPPRRPASDSARCVPYSHSPTEPLLVQDGCCVARYGQLSESENRSERNLDLQHRHGSLDRRRLWTSSPLQLGCRLGRRARARLHLRAQKVPGKS